MQVLPQAIGIARAETSLNCVMGLRPYRDGAGQKIPSARSQLQDASPMVAVVRRNVDQATAFQRFQGGG